MSNRQSLSRRSFVQAASVGLGTGVVAATAPASAAEDAGGRPPREIWVATFCQSKLSADSSEEMIKKVLSQMEKVLPARPDVICLPECFHTANVSNRPQPAEAAEQPIGRISKPFAEFAARHRCNVICPIFTVESGRIYNAAVVIDRQGNYVGEYRKINPTVGELENGITPGPIDPPVFQLDIGTIGIQICFDVNWHENWRRLAAKAAELVFWPSAFSGGQMLNALAATNKYYVAASTRSPSSKLVNPLGDDIVATGRFGQWTLAPVNLDMAVIQGYQDIGKLGAVQAKYGRQVRITTKHDEAWSLVESVSHDVSVPEILAEFEIETSRDMLARCTKVQDRYRP